ncbi:hypothetical protein SAMN02799624_04712 [Paenibacillus sp. UNC496MF]|uniref:hypothetical protein n=1 Tax=Paenibacillus sp. UNC496MF TaxID=1502753 RepID=UPI0008E2E4E1|nr:hypothetical protein [Paenibacillus sp. UNC496MF]SFJ49101.1 hypothetical protein SAMN02799624_04712 [Paenibacillus sp. UNC496MF]
MLLIPALLLAAQPVTAASKTAKIKVTFVRATLAQNDHVGNEWRTGGYVNGKEVPEGGSVTLNVKSTDAIKLLAEAQEQDKYPDDGQASAAVKVSSVTKSLDKALSVTVTENRGRYSGNTAKWTFAFKIQRVS